jgi:hypothetical protein
MRLEILQHAEPLLDRRIIGLLLQIIISGSREPEINTSQNDDNTQQYEKADSTPKGESR